jgi:Tol biopolymer transport system component
MWGSHETASAPAHPSAAETGVDPACSVPTVALPRSLLVAFSGPEGILTMRGDGSDRRVAVSDSRAFDPALSPDGRAVAYRLAVNEPTTPERIGVQSLEPSGETIPRNLTGPGLAGFPDWSPDGELIAFASGRSIEVVRPDGTGRRTLGIEGEDPAWSPDGRQLAFNRRMGQDEVFVALADGSSPRNLTSSPADEEHPTWSPGGERIAVIRNEAGEPGVLLVMDANGSSQDDITGVGGSFPFWLPNGRIMLAGPDCTGDGEPDLFLVNPDGSTLARPRGLVDVGFPVDVVLLG